MLPLPPWLDPAEPLRSGRMWQGSAMQVHLVDGTYELYPVTFTDTGSPPVTVQPVATAPAGALTIASQNMLHFFDTVVQEVLELCPEAWYLQVANPVFAGCTWLGRAVR